MAAGTDGIRHGRRRFVTGHHHRRVQFDVEQANGTGGFRPLGRLSDDPASDVSFDPTLHCPPGVKLLPGWLTDFRRLAYRRSQAVEHRGAFKLAVARRNQTR